MSAIEAVMKPTEDLLSELDGAAREHGVVMDRCRDLFTRMEAVVRKT